MVAGDSNPDPASGRPPTLTNIQDQAQKELRLRLGKYGYNSLQLATRRNQPRRQQYSLSMISAISQRQVLATQLVEGGVDSTLFENFIYHTLRSIRADPRQ